MTTRTIWLHRLTPRDRIRALLDERRWSQYARSPLSIFYRVQG